MIDFSKARASTRRLTHSEPWELGNEEDGEIQFLFVMCDTARGTAWGAVLETAGAG